MAKQLQLYEYSGRLYVLNTLCYLNEGVAEPYSHELVRDGPLVPELLLRVREWGGQQEKPNHAWFEHVPQDAPKCLPSVLKPAHVAVMTDDALVNRLADDLQCIPSGGGTTGAYGVRINAENAALIIQEMVKRAGNHAR